MLYIFLFYVSEMVRYRDKAGELQDSLLQKKEQAGVSELAKKKKKKKELSLFTALILLTSLLRLIPQDAAEAAALKTLILEKEQLISTLKSDKAKLEAYTRDTLKAVQEKVTFLACTWLEIGFY